MIGSTRNVFNAHAIRLRFHMCGGGGICSFRKDRHHPPQTVQLGFDRSYAAWAAVDGSTPRIIKKRCRGRSIKPFVEAITIVVIMTCNYKLNSPF